MLKARSASRPARFSKVTAPRVGIFLCAALTVIPLDSKGKLFLGELLLPLVSVAVLLFSSVRRWKGNRVLRRCLLALLLTLTGYMLADLVHHTQSGDLVRGWARIVVLGTNMFGLSLLALQDESYLWWYSLGLGVGGMATYAAMATPFDQWKFSYALPASSIVLCLAAFFSRIGAAVLMGGYGLVNLTVLDSRAVGAILLLVGVLVWARNRSRRRRKVLSSGKLMTAGVAAMVLLIGAYAATQAVYGIRRHFSNAIRWANAEAAVTAIADSPIVGHGSWAVDLKMEMAYQLAYYAFTGEHADPETTHYGANLPHSQILSVWYEGGLLGITFFAYFGYLLIRYTIYCAVTRPYNYLTTLYLFTTVHALWHLIMSPFGGSQRLVIAFAVAVLCRLYEEREPAVIAEPEMLKTA